MDQYPRNDTYGDVFSERVVHPAGDAESPVGDITIASHEQHGSDETELFGNHRENEVPLDFRKISELLNGFSESQAEESSASYGDKPLFGLEINGSVRNGRLIVRKEVVDTFRNVRQGVPSAVGSLSESVDGTREERTDKERDENMFDIASSHEEHDNDNRSDKQNGSEVRLEG